MERRASTRTAYRLPAEIVHGGERHFGFLADVSALGAFVQTTRAIPVGSEIELRFTDDQLAPQLARARVVRRRSVPAAAAPLTRAGIGVQWIDAPQFARELAGSGWIDVVVEGDDVSSEAPEPVSLACDASPAQAATTSLEEAAPQGEPPGAAAGEPSQPDPGASVGEIVRVESSPLMEESVELGPVTVRAEVALIDEGELGEIDALLRAIGARTFRMRWGAQAEPVAWEAPPRLIVVPARIAMGVPLSDAVMGANAVGIAVCDSEAGTLRARLRQQGYEIALQRSAHPETLRLLFASLLSRQRERRKQPRRAFGSGVTFWRRLRRQHGTLLEVSSSGASLLLPEPLPRGAKLTLRIAAKHAGGRALALPCAVLRVGASAHGVVLGLRFASLSARKRARLEALVRTLAASGPVPQAPLAGRRARRAGSPRVERRQDAREKVALQALALDASRRASDVLFGTDLSLGGMRIEPHPRLARGAELELALQPPGGREPVLLRADVARDDGERGLVLRFRTLSREARLAIERILEGAAEVARTPSSASEREQPIVLGTWGDARAAS
jgi:hypothetical protein